jgi:hypothetical protein
MSSETTMARKKTPRKPPNRSTDSQIYIRTSSEVTAALERYAIEEDRPLSKAAERLLIDALRRLGHLPSPTVPGPAATEDRVRGGAETVS